MTEQASSRAAIDLPSKGLAGHVQSHPRLRPCPLFRPCHHRQAGCGFRRRKSPFVALLYIVIRFDPVEAQCCGAISSCLCLGRHAPHLQRHLKLCSLAGGVAIHSLYGAYQGQSTFICCSLERRQLSGNLMRIVLMALVNHAKETYRLHLDSPAKFPGPPSSRASRTTDVGKDARNLEGSAANEEKPQQTGILLDWSSIGDRITEAVVPDWAQRLPAFIAKFQKEMALEPNTLAEEIWNNSRDADIHPEIARSASVRVSEELCQEEEQFLEKRKHFTRQALAKYLDLAESDIHPDDVPVIAMCGSGGGLRALVAGASSYYSAQKAGLFDCVTYTAGVSGSCWLQTLYHSSLANQDLGKLLQHLKNRIGIHIAFPPPVLSLVTSAPTDKYLMSGVFEKYHGIKDADFGLVDVYGLLLGARLMVPRNELSINPDDLKLSHQRQYVDQGANPLPIYTAVRHEIPLQETTNNSKGGKSQEDISKKALQEAWFQWFEFTPYELFCEELGCGIPTWAVGRQFSAGKSVAREHGYVLPELRIPLLMGIWGSAFCATLSHYYKEIRPLVLGLTGFGGLDAMISERNDDLVKVHPIDPAQIPNFALGMKHVLSDRVPESIHRNKDIALMDAGMSNNLPIYPLLRPGRNVDIIIAFDASADIQKENWLRVADGYARQRGIKGWPLGTGWPDKEVNTSKDTGKAIDEAYSASTKGAERKVEQADADQKQMERETPNSDAVGQGTIWVGTTEERTSTEEPPQSKRVEADWQLMTPDAGIAVVYFPLLPNPRVAGVDPDTSEFMSTWNFVYTPDDIDSVVRLAQENFRDGEQRTKMAVHAVYERKRRVREEREQEERRARGGLWGDIPEMKVS
ncbi:hypothetical protein FH972_021609 [Carpinus fangiana]|uniref:PLA2c domain-containing protein n=1 Tax=Carpinus fangiana TaxID=176857 RepID=A0A5N6KPS5_9ROSI|nr:hypothetical protein FH972_021609 [Carpinus fangiana]